MTGGFMSAQSERRSVLTQDTYQFQAFQVCPDSRQLERDFLCMLASLESRNLHPLATEIVQIARLNNILPVSVTGYQNFPGRGVGGMITLPSEHQPRAMLVGSQEFIEGNGLQVPELLKTTIQQWSSEPNILVVLGGWDGWVRGALRFLRLRLPQ
jgi:cation transport ATPase